MVKDVRLRSLPVKFDSRRVYKYFAVEPALE